MAKVIQLVVENTPDRAVTPFIFALTDTGDIYFNTTKSDDLTLREWTKVISPIPLEVDKKPEPTPEPSDGKERT